MSKIELKDITLDYTDQGNVYHALDGVTFSVEEGEFVSLIGSSGCGKLSADVNHSFRGAPDEGVPLLCNRINMYII